MILVAETHSEGLAELLVVVLGKFFENQNQRVLWTSHVVNSDGETLENRLKTN